MLGVKAAISLVHRLAYAQGQACSPCEQEKKHDVDYCLPSLEALGLSPDSLPRTSDGLSRSIHLRGSCPHYAAMLES
jgi:hypothetical protein